MKPTEIKSVESITIQRVTVDVKACNKTVLVYMIPHEEDGEIAHEYFISENLLSDMHYYTELCGSGDGLISFAEGAAFLYAMHQHKNESNSSTKEGTATTNNAKTSS